LVSGRPLGALKTIQKCGGRSPSHFWMVLKPPGAAQTPKTDPNNSGQTAFRYPGSIAFGASNSPDSHCPDPRRLIIAALPHFAKEESRTTGFLGDYSVASGLSAVGVAPGAHSCISGAGDTRVPGAMGTRYTRVSSLSWFRASTSLGYGRVPGIAGSCVYPGPRYILIHGMPDWTG
jgi:hypothetical protein